MGFGPAAAIAMVFAAVIGALLYLLVFRPLRDAPQLAQAVASLGVLVVMQGALAVRLGTAPISVAPLFVKQRWVLGRVVIQSDRAYLALAVIGLTALLAAMYRFTRFGLVTQAVSESQTGSYVSRISPDRVALLNWIVSAMVAGAAGILIAPLSPLTPITYTLFVVPGAGRRGRRALPVPHRDGRGGPRHRHAPDRGTVPREPVQLDAPDRRRGDGPADRDPRRAAGRRAGTCPREVASPSSRSGRRPAPAGSLLPAVVGTTIGLVALLATSGEWRAAVITSFIAAIIGLSLVVVTGYAGQVSLAQLALAGVGRVHPQLPHRRPGTSRSRSRRCSPRWWRR